ncbi:thioesterase domain-containing protein [Staphylococcus epidermidis]|nr:thioesterase domain-containing protein [Staphylococcus epidermidis]
MNLNISNNGNNLTFIPIDLPGRDSSISSELIHKFDIALKYIYIYIKKKIHKNENFALLGYSMGSVLAIELAKKFNDNNYKPPNLILMASNTPNNFNFTNLKEINKDEKSIISTIQKLGGTSKKLLYSQFFQKKYIPIFKADFNILISYKSKNTKLRQDVLIINGKNDYIASNNYSVWKRFTEGNVQIRKVEGGHFFLNENIDVIESIIKEFLLIRRKK